tara:strand:- start:253 stop:579 length:327 start_codon:yes stop_codon:yes gene_type:complete
MQKIIQQFDSQIKTELKYNSNDKKKCPSYWAKLIFLETKEFNRYNWKIIQTDEYLSKKDYYQRIIKDLDDFFKRQEILTEQYKFMYDSVIEHKKRLTKINGEMYYELP